MIIHIHEHLEPCLLRHCNASHTGMVSLGSHETEPFGLASAVMASATQVTKSNAVSRKLHFIQMYQSNTVPLRHLLTRRLSCPGALTRQDPSGWLWQLGYHPHMLPSHTIVGCIQAVLHKGCHYCLQPCLITKIESSCGSHPLDSSGWLQQ